MPSTARAISEPDRQRIHQRCADAEEIRGTIACSTRISSAARMRLLRLPDRVLLDVRDAVSPGKGGGGPCRYGGGGQG
jgi:hypothetical protein